MSPFFWTVGRHTTLDQTFKIVPSAGVVHSPSSRECQGNMQTHNAAKTRSIAKWAPIDRERTNERNGNVNKQIKQKTVGSNILFRVRTSNGGRVLYWGFFSFSTKRHTQAYENRKIGSIDEFVNQSFCPTGLSWFWGFLLFLLHQRVYSKGNSKGLSDSLASGFWWIPFKFILNSSATPVTSNTKPNGAWMLEKCARKARKKWRMGLKKVNLCRKNKKASVGRRSNDWSLARVGRFVWGILGLYSWRESSAGEVAS